LPSGEFQAARLADVADTMWDEFLMADYSDFVHIGPGTLAGRYLRLFWQPVFRSQDLPPGKAVPVRLLGEDFTLYRGTGGEAHVVAFRCAHRGTQLSSGWVEGDDIRCLYHGWKYGAAGQCLEQPGEDETFAGKVRIASYPTREYLGLIFIYLGTGDPPPLRRFPDFERPGVLEAGPPEYWPCNYFNRLDNARDHAHVPWTHRESLSRTAAAGATGSSRPQRGPTRVEASLRATAEEAETEYGIRSSRVLPDGRMICSHFHMPNINQNRSSTRVEGSLADAANLWVDRLFWRVPVDDENAVSFVVDLVPLTGTEGEAYRQRRQQAAEEQTAPLQDLAEAVLRGELRVRDMPRDLSMYKMFWIEDYVVQVGQGPIADRPSEHLGRVDRGTILLRKLWRRELEALAEGGPLKQWQSVAGLADMTTGLGAKPAA